MSIVKYLIPINIGQKKNGIEKGPKYINDNYDFNNKNIETKEFIYNKSLSKIEIYSKLKNDIKKLNYDLSIFIGGDHSMSLGTISGLYNLEDDDICVIWLDAHTDCNNFKESISQNIHGMPISGLMGDLEEPYNSFKCLNYNQLCYFGTRSIDLYEQKYIDSHNINNITMANINEDLNESLNKLDEFINNRKIHISFDVDILDPTIISSTGVPEENGMSIETMKETLLFLKNYDIKSIDITEFNPELGDKNKSFKNLSEILDVLFKNK